VRRHPRVARTSIRKTHHDARGTYDVLTKVASIGRSIRDACREKVKAKGPNAKGLNFPEEYRPSASVQASPKKTPTPRRRKRVQEHESHSPTREKEASEMGEEKDRVVEEERGRRSKPSTGGVLESIRKVMTNLAQWLTLSLLLVGLVLGILMPLRGTPAFDKIVSTSQQILNVGKYTDMMHESWLCQELPLRVERVVDNLPLAGAYTLAGQLSRKLESLKAFLLERSSRSCAADANRAVLKSMVETSDGVWCEVVDRMMDNLNQSDHEGRPADAAKALVALFLTPSRSAVDEVRSNMDKAFSRCAELDCLLKINLQDYGDLNASLQQVQEWKASLQRRLANFLRRCPSGVVFVENLLTLHPLVVPALSNGMGEQGAYFQDGVSVGASSATFLLTTGHLPIQIAGLTEEELSTVVKGSIVSAFSKAKDDMLNTQDDRVIFANAFRRRIDHVIPVKSFAPEQDQEVV